MVELNRRNKKTRRFLVLGFGIVSVSDNTDESAVLVADQSSLGIYAGNLPGMSFGAGYQSSTVTAISNPEKAEDVRVEVTRKPFGKVNVISESVEFNETIKEESDE